MFFYTIICKTGDVEIAIRLLNFMCIYFCVQVHSKRLMFLISDIKHIIKTIGMTMGPIKQDIRIFKYTTIIVTITLPDIIYLDDFLNA